MTDQKIVHCKSCFAICAFIHVSSPPLYPHWRLFNSHLVCISHPDYIATPVNLLHLMLLIYSASLTVNLFQSALLLLFSYLSWSMARFSLLLFCFVPVSFRPVWGFDVLWSPLVIFHPTERYHSDLLHGPPVTPLRHWLLICGLSVTAAARFNPLLSLRPIV